MEKFAKVGDFCQNENCKNFGKIQNEEQHNIQKFGKTRAGMQRFRCKTCLKTFTETKGTIFYKKRSPHDEMLETLALLAEGNRISSLHRVKGFKEDTILQWLREAAEHAEQIEEVLLKDYKVKKAQLDALWSYVGHKGEKKTIQKRKRKANFGEQR